MSEEEDIKERFRLICKKCGSEDVRISVEPAYSYSEMTGGGGYMTIGCNECKQNDLMVWC